MKKRILSLALSLLLVVTALPLPAAAEEFAMTTSEAGIEMIKRFEGFSAWPVVDGSQWSIGYGNACNPADYPNGITEAGADALLRESLLYFEESLNRYLTSRGIALNQSQFDALVSVTYNLGVAWINSSYRFWTILGDGMENYTVNQVASALGVWSHVGTTVSVSLLQRRIQEAQLLLYGDYDGTESVGFCYLVLNGNGGEVETDVMLYQENEPYAAFPEATRPGYYFAGWYTEREGGERLLSWERATHSGAVYAHWSDQPVAEPEPPEDPDSPENPSVTPGPVETPDPAEQHPVATFPDVQESDWCYPYVSGLASAGIVSGFGDGLYRPAAPVTTGQALKLILLAAGYPEQEPVSRHWASGYRSFALQQHFVFDGELGDLDEPITRELMAKLAANAVGAVYDGAPTVFFDTDSPYVIALYRLGVLSGSEDYATGNRMYYPDNTTTRAEIAKVVWLLRNL